jgi:hypothetical protein
MPISEAFLPAGKSEEEMHGMALYWTRYTLCNADGPQTLPAEDIFSGKPED